MATGGEVQGQLPDSVGSEDLQNLKCQPCLEDGDLQEAVGMCVDCQDYLCLKCYQGHTLPKPMRRHQLLDREQMMQSRIRLSPKDACTEKCSVHEDEVIKYYCITHCQLCCSVCVTLDHTTCKGVQYIPQVAKELAQNKEYKQVESQLRIALKLFQIVTENTERNSEEFVANCNEALKQIKKHIRKVEKAFDNIATQLVEKTQELKSAEIVQFTSIRDKYKRAQQDLQASLTKIETLENGSQHCSSYIEMMRTNEKLVSLDDQIQEAVMHTSRGQLQVKFTPNQDILDNLKSLDAYATVSLSSTQTIVGVKHAQDINVRSGTDNERCDIRGSVFLTYDRLALADYDNSSVKILDVQNGKILSQLKLSSGPWDIAAISEIKAAVTLPDAKKVVIVTEDDDDNLCIDTTLTVSGACYGADYSDDKLAVSFTDPHKVQILNLQGTVLYDISVDKQGKTLFNKPLYLTYGQDDTTLYVSNYFSHNVVCVKLDGTVVATYTNRDIQYPRTPVVDSNGNLYVCAEGSPTVHQISKDCERLLVLLTKADGLSSPRSICLDKEGDMLYVTNYDEDCVQVYEILQSL